MAIGMRTWRRRAVLVAALAATVTASMCPVAASAEPVAPDVSAVVAAHAAVLRAAGMAPQPAPTPSARVDADGAELFEPLNGRTIGVGDAHTCAATLFDTVWCWGANGSGQLGDGSTTDSALPVQAGPDSALKDKYPLAVAAGRAHTCVLALTEYLETALYCWGDNGQGQLGDSSLTGRTSPVQVAAQAYQVAVGHDHTCVVTEQRTVSCWGRNDTGQLGIGTLSAAESTPQEVPGLTGIVDISAGDDNTCVVDGDGDAWCWGSDSHGQLGDGGGAGTPRMSPVPVTMTGVDNGFRRIDVGARHVCAIAEGGDDESSMQLYCWGDDSAGQLGNGGSAADASEPTAVSAAGQQFVTVAAGGDASCATTVTGAGYCWGGNGGGHLGVGDTTDRSTPTTLDAGAVPSSPITEFFLGRDAVMLVDVNVGDRHGCAVTVEQGVYCWGSNTDGQLGDGSTDDADAPTATALMPGPATRVRVSAADESLPVTWVAPADTGVAPVREYAAIALDRTGPDADVTGCKTAGTPSCTLTDLINGRPYDVLVATATLGGVSYSALARGTPRGAPDGGGGGGLPITGRDVALPLAAGGLLLGTGLLLLSISRRRLRRNI
jgi:alpha-tubulin suppressor-like RCC1 family protein